MKDTIDSISIKVSKFAGVLILNIILVIPNIATANEYLKNSICKSYQEYLSNNSGGILPIKWGFVDKDMLENPDYYKGFMVAKLTKDDFWFGYNYAYRNKYFIRGKRSYEDISLTDTYLDVVGGEQISRARGLNLRNKARERIKSVSWWKSVYYLTSSGSNIELWIKNRMAFVSFYKEGSVLVFLIKKNDVTPYCYL